MMDVKNVETIWQETMRKARHSLLVSGSYVDRISISEVYSLLGNGIKVILFLDARNEERLIAHRNAAGFNKEKGRLLWIHRMERIPSLQFCVADGEGVDADSIKALGMEAPSFNAEQYLIEHAGTEVMRTIVVKASAGTGKTTVMVDRVLFLLHTERISPRDIIMVTFTQAAAKNMREKIIGKFSELFVSTGDGRYLEWMEQCSDMQISTIHSFFKKVIQSERYALGYGSGITVRGVRKVKQDIICKVMDELYREENQGKTYGQMYGLPLNEYQKIVLDCWEKLEERGFFLDRIQAMDFGKETYTDRGYYRADKKVQAYLQKLIVRAVELYQEYRLREDVLSVNDFNQVVATLQENPKITRLRTIKARFLFVDEFQDTDRSQLEAIAWLAYRLESQLFVVGDVKQSIYRFRGADETAFQQLCTLIVDNYHGRIDDTVSLVKNYRTEPELIAALNPLFSEWMQQGFLAQGDEAVAGVVSGRTTGRLQLFAYKKKDDRECLVRSHLRCCKDRYDEYADCLQDYEERKDKAVKPVKVMLKRRLDRLRRECFCEIAVLNKKNSEVADIVAWCREEKIPCVARVDGGFYKNEAVIDAYHLLGALLYPRDMRKRYNYLMTPYASEQPDVQEISDRSGNPEALAVYMDSLSERNGWPVLLAHVRKIPFFQLLREIVAAACPVDAYGKRRMAELMSEGYSLEDAKTMTEYDTQRYRLNLNKLMQLFFEHFKGDFCSLWNAYMFLKQHIATDTQEEEVYPEDENRVGFMVKAMTVHKSKGLEFEAVLITHMDSPYWYDRTIPLKKVSKRRSTDFIIDDSEQPTRLGWLYQKKHAKGSMYNKYYKDGKVDEANARTRDEARILYVAMTRAERYLGCFLPKQHKEQDDTWARLLRDGFKDGGISYETTDH